MKNLVLYCKSYSGDLLRFLRLASSIQKFNVDKIEFYASVPSKDLNLFKQNVAGLELTMICDEDIIAANSKLDWKKLAAMKGSVSQQIVKSEFWRLGISENYVCLDSDNEFIKAFRISDFVCGDGIPYTVIGEGKEYLSYFASRKIEKVRDYFVQEALDGQVFFGRAGKAYDFGIPPLVWSRRVWESLDGFLISKDLSLADAVAMHPFELRLYGEALLKFNAIPLRPAEPFFRTYLHEIQYRADQKRGVTLDVVRENYLGVVKQSNWDGIGYRESKSWLSMLGRKLKGVLRNIRA